MQNEPTFVAFAAHFAAAAAVLYLAKHGLNINVDELTTFLTTLLTGLVAMLWNRSKVAPMKKIQAIAPDVHAQLMGKKL